MSRSSPTVDTCLLGAGHRCGGRCIASPSSSINTVSQVAAVCDLFYCLWRAKTVSHLERWSKVKTITISTRPLHSMYNHETFRCHGLHLFGTVHPRLLVQKCVLICICHDHDCYSLILDFDLLLAKGAKVCRKAD